MKPTNEQMSQQLSVRVSDGQLQISIGIALMAYVAQIQDQWPEDARVSDVLEFAKSMAQRLTQEEEDGTTLVHRMLDFAAEQVLEQGDDGVDEGGVEEGLDYVKTILDGKAILP